MYKGSSSRVVPIIIVLIIIAVAIAALVSVGRAMFGGTATPAVADTGHTALVDTSANHSVRMTVRGPIVADETFRSYQMTVDSSRRMLVTYSGYLGQVIATQSLGNNVKAYEEFVYALDKAALMQGTALTGEADDIRGICATGSVYEFDVLVGTNTVKHLWTSSCKGSKGSFKASLTQVQALFLVQFPDSQKLLSTLDI